LPSPLVSLLIAAFGLLAVHLAGRRNPLLAAITLATLLALPFLNFLPKIHLTLPSATETLVTKSHTSLLVVAYFLGIFVFSLRYLGDVVALYRWRKNSRSAESTALTTTLRSCQKQLGYLRPVEIRLHRELASPLAVGLVRPVIYLPVDYTTWSPATLRAVLMHELGHHLRRDLWTSLAARLACILHWFNPLAWLLRRRLLAQCEFACDARVLATGIDAQSYAHTLCNLALPKSNHSPALALAMATKSSLRARVENLVAPSRPLTLFPIVGTLLLTLGTALALSTLRPASSSPFSKDLSTTETQLRLTANPFPGN
jgi:beta-lactamase regulating signal transducer with metallopeptidase domain